MSISPVATHFTTLPQAVPMRVAPPPESGPVDEVQLSITPEQRQNQAAQQMVSSLGEQLRDGIEGWQVYHVDKPSFPYQVEKQAQIGQERANRIINSNQKHADRVLNRENNLRSVLREALMDAGVESPQINPSDVKSLQDFFAERVNRKTNFYYSGTLCTVGWGSGDQEAARGYPPNGPKTTSGILMKGADAKILEVVRGYIRPA